MNLSLRLHHLPEKWLRCQTSRSLENLDISPRSKTNGFLDVLGRGGVQRAGRWARRKLVLERHDGPSQPEMQEKKQSVGGALGQA